MRDRADAYAAAFPEYPGSHARVVSGKGGEVLYATWVLGNNYRAKTQLYGAYPPGYLARVYALFPDVLPVEGNDPRPTTLHAFSGSIQAGPYARVDAVERFAGSRYEFYKANLSGETLLESWQFRLVLADPPYSTADAQRYGTEMVNRRLVLRNLARATRRGGHLAWLDTCWPMHRADDWRSCGWITVVRSTNHRVRLLTLFERR